MTTLPPTTYSVTVETVQAEAAQLGRLLREAWGTEPVEVLAHGRDRTLLQIFFDEETKALLAARVLEARPEVRAVQLGATRPEDWQAMFRRHFSTREIGERLRIAPTWERNRISTDDRTTLFIEPGLGFGTGEHFTTRFCLEQIDRLWAGTAPVSLLDIGTGSGILAMAAASLGCPRVVATDHDADSLRCATETLALNRLEGRVEFLAADIESDSLPGPFEVVCANLFSNLLKDCARRIARASSRWLLLSGIREDEADGVAETYGRLGATEVGRDGDGEWVGLVFRVDLAPTDAINGS